MKPALPEPRSRICVVGRTGFGKSTEVKEVIRSWLSRGVRVVALDCCDEYSVHGLPTGLVRLGPLKRRVTAPQLAADPAMLLDPRLSLAVVPGDGPKAWARTFMMLAKMVRHAGRLVLVVDETGTWTDASNHPACHQAKAELVSLATNGRHKGVALVVVAQRAAQIPPGVRSQASEWWAFRQDEPSDLEALAERLGKDTAERVRQLHIGEAVKWRDNTIDAKPKLRAV